MAKITKDMKIGKIVRKYPAAVPVMLNYGLHCVNCPIASMESLEKGAKAHGLSDEQIDRLLKEMNEVVEEG